MTRTMRLAELLPDVAGVPADLEIGGLVMDSREVTPGDAFVAIAGFGAHGLNFVAQARAAGASAILFEPPAPADTARAGRCDRRAGPARTPGRDGRPLPRPSQRGDDDGRRHRHQRQDFDRAVAGAGVDAARHARRHHRHARRGPVWRSGGRPASPRRWCCACTRCSPSCATPARRRWRWKSVRTRSTRAASAACISMSRCSPTSPATTSTTTATWTSYGAAKAKLFGWPGLQAAVINLDDELRPRAARRPAGGVAPDRPEFARRSRRRRCAPTRLRLDNRGIGFDLVVAGERHAVQSPLLGRFNVDNLLAVAGALHALGDRAGADRADAVATAADPRPHEPPRRRRHGMPLVVIDYAHTPDALEQALAALRCACRRRA